MDFTVSETQQEIAGLAARVLRGARPVPVAAPPGVAAGRDGGYDAARWKELAQAGLLSLALPEELGGDGLGAAEAGALLAETGRAGAVVPVLATVMTGVLPVTRWAGRDLAGRLLAGVGTGGTVLTAALREPSQPSPAVPATTATLEGGGTVTGVKVGVPYAAEADWVLVPARLAGGGSAVVVISPGADGVTTVRTPSSAGDPEYTLRLAATPVTGVIGDDVSDEDPVTGRYELAAAGACCVADGALAAALALTTASGVVTRRADGVRQLQPALHGNGVDRGLVDDDLGNTAAAANLDSHRNVLAGHRGARPSHERARPSACLVGILAREPLGKVPAIMT